jgi:TetR/AcrR family transcriptional regulator, ethionamide resistance regulator
MKALAKNAPSSFTVQAKSGQARRAETRGEIIRATRELLESGDPLALLSIERIVAEANVSRPTFYRHFRDKQDLMAELAQEQVLWIEEVGRGAASSGADLTRGDVDATVSSLVARWAENRRVLAAVIELASYDARMDKTWRAAMQEVGEVAAGMFASAWSTGGAMPEDPETVAEVLSWMIERSCHQIAHDAVSEKRVAGALSEVIWRVLHPAR